jgi:glycogen debranching enzyme GlgX
MHVDGFRFDLAAALARQFYEVDRLSAFFEIIHQDPVLSQVKLVAEPWDIGKGGYQVGNFPVRWAEWNGRYRDTVRDYWRGQSGGISDLAYRLTGSSDLYQGDGRRPSASINFVTCHDGFTLRDLVSFNEKHNDANGEDNRDGSDDNRSWNCGVEGDTEDEQVLELRARQVRNFLATVLLSQGCPMISHGDELGQTQAGNNNAYCQDNELTWIDWENADQQLIDWTRRLIKLRSEQPVLHRQKFFVGAVGRGTRRKDLVWVRPDGQEMKDPNWRNRSLLSVGMPRPPRAARLEASGRALGAGMGGRGGHRQALRGARGTALPGRPDAGPGSPLTGRPAPDGVTGRYFCGILCYTQTCYRDCGVCNSGPSPPSVCARVPSTSLTSSLEADSAVHSVDKSVESFCRTFSDRGVGR